MALKIMMSGASLINRHGRKMMINRVDGSDEIDPSFCIETGDAEEGSQHFEFRWSESASVIDAIKLVVEGG